MFKHPKMHEKEQFPNSVFVQWELNHFKRYFRALFNFQPEPTRARDQGAFGRTTWTKESARTKKKNVNFFPAQLKTKGFSALLLSQKTSCGISPGTFPHCQNNPATTLKNIQKSLANGGWVMTALQLLRLRPLPLDTKQTPTLAWTFAASFHHSYSSCGLIKDEIWEVQVGGEENSNKILKHRQLSAVALDRPHRGQHFTRES